MSLSAVQAPPGREADRRAHILAAAQRAFVREGFHAATMQDVAAEAGMSPGNLYRYFRSKEAIVAGLCARDQSALAADFNTLTPSEDVLGAIRLMLRKHLVDEPRRRFQLVVEIWAEATRNPEVAAMCAGMDREVRTHLSAFIERARQHGATAPNLDVQFAVRVILTLGTGLFKRRAHEPDFDGESELGLAVAVIAGVFSGAVRPLSSPGDVP